MTHLMSPGLQNKKDILFGNMEEIYHFHNRLGNHVQLKKKQCAGGQG